jgi:TPR repeat protein
MRGVASLDPASIILVGALVGAAYLVFVYTRRHLTQSRRKPSTRRSVRVSDARLYSRYRAITRELEGAGVVREPQETPEEYARRAAERLGAPGMARLGEIYLYARFRDAVPAALVEEFDRLEPEALSAISRSKETARREPSESKRADTSSL